MVNQKQEKESLLLVERNKEGYAVITLNRPKVLNALNFALLTELAAVFSELDQDDSIKVVILTGNERAFAAGADIQELTEATPLQLLKSNEFATWETLRRVRKPIIAAVSGYTLGGGCELMMLCDIIIASETAIFGQPEITLGIIPGAGATQRLTRIVGKYLAMEMILNARMLTAREALKVGLVNQVVPVELYLDEARKMATEMAKRAPLALIQAKEAIMRSFDLGIADGLDFERQNFYLLFGTEDQREGMKAFLDKREPDFKGK